MEAATTAILQIRKATADTKEGEEQTGCGAKCKAILFCQRSLLLQHTAVVFQGDLMGTTTRD